MKELIINLFGEYEQQYNDKGNLIGGIAGLDYEWLVGVFLFIVILYCVFRIIGGILK